MVESMEKVACFCLSRASDFISWRTRIFSITRRNILGKSADLPFQHHYEVFFGYLMLSIASRSISSTFSPLLFPVSTWLAVVVGRNGMYLHYHALFRLVRLQFLLFKCTHHVTGCLHYMILYIK